MALLSLRGIELAFGGYDLLHDVELHLEAGDRLCLLGRNGSGKSSLLRIMAGRWAPDAGQVSYEKGAVVAYLGQQIEEDLSGTALAVAAGGELEEAYGAPTVRRIEAERILTQLSIPHDAAVDTLSGGGKRRVFLARELAAGADVLLLDEPTNHLDIETVLWLEEFLLRGAPTRFGSGKAPAVVFVTHDRAFARRLATRVAEIDRGTLYSFDCGYREFLDRREELLAAEAQSRAKFDKQLAKEEAWLARGVKARRTRNEGRVKKLLEMRNQHERRRERAGSVGMSINEATRSGRLVVETEDLSFGYDSDAELIRNLSTLILRGDRVGIAGRNGSGKTTLVRLLLGELPPRSGRVRLGVGLEVVYLDQMRSILDPEKTVAENLGDGSDVIRSPTGTRHIRAYLQEFLFDADDADKPVAVLSGGERNRLLLAKLFSRPSNLIVLDEPTNDLDVDTLEVLEDRLLQYDGTILLVSHDRELLDNVVTDTLVLPGDGSVIEHTGGYTDWRERELDRHSVDAEGSARDGAEPPSLRAGSRTSSSRATSPAAKSSGGQDPRQSRRQKPADRRRKLTFKESQELSELPERISELEGRQSELHDRLSDPELYKGNPDGVREMTAELEEIEKQLAAAFARWEELDTVAEAGG